MDWKTHVLFGLVCCTLAVFALSQFSIPIDVSPASLGIAVLYSILPDIDHRNSTITHLFQLVLFLAIVYFIFEYFSDSARAILGAVACVGLYVFHQFYAKDSKMHRAFPHTILFGILAVGICFFITKSYSGSAIAGIAFSSHLIGDMHFKLI